MSNAPRQDVSLPKEHTRRAEFWAGVVKTVPLIIGAIPFGIIFGAVAVNAGISPAGAAAMSAFVFAGSAQFVAAGLVAVGSSVAVIVLTTLIVNLRHSLYAATLAPHTSHLGHRWLLPLGFWLTDETFLVVARRFERADGGPYRHWFYFGSALFMYINWQLCTYIGILAGRSIPNPASWGLDFALPATFIAMLIPQMKSRAIVATVIVAALAAILLRQLPHQSGLIIAVILGVVTGTLFEKKNG